MERTTSLSPARISLEECAFHEMVACAQAGYPEEVAGLLLGRSQAACIHVDRFLRVANSQRAEARTCSYQISSADWQSGERQARDLALELIGVFHSHPDHPSQPSSTDLECALPNFIYIIAAIHQQTLAGLQAWQLREDRSQFEHCVLCLPQEEPGV